MGPIKIMVNGLPGNMARIFVQHALADPIFDVLPYSLTGPEIEDSACTIAGMTAGVDPSAKPRKSHG